MTPTRKPPTTEEIQAAKGALREVLDGAREVHVSVPRVRDLLEWNDVLPDLRIVEEEHGATPTFMVVADYGWAERILCGGCYQQDAEAILAALNEAKRA